jgi:Zn-dependent protease with chaperone function
MERMFARPPGYPTAVSWLLTGFFRNWRGLFAALIAAWFNLPLAVFLGGLGLVLGGIAGYVGGFSGGTAVGSEYIVDIPVAGTMLKSVLLQSGGILGALVGIAGGAVAGFVGGLILPWVLVAADNPGSAVGLMLAQVFVAVFVGLLYTIYSIAAEGWLLRIEGAREPSRRERELILPILVDCAARLGLGAHPRLLMDDSREVNAFAGARHIVVTRGFLDEFNATS